QLAARLGSELGLPVFLYAEAATRPERRLLPDIRKPQYEGLADLVGRDPRFAPDFGPARLGPAGATAVGARPFLVAFNVNLASALVGLLPTAALAATSAWALQLPALTPHQAVETRLLELLARQTAHSI